MLHLIRLDEQSRIPKYIQIINSIIHNISVGNVTLGDKIPSINKLSQEFYLSRDTVERAYNILKQRNIIVSIHGKGTYIAKTRTINKLNILFLVNKLSRHKLRIYNAFLKEVKKEANVVLHCYHCDETLFLELLNKNISSYDYHVIIPHFRNQDLSYANITSNISKALEAIPKEKLLILDNNKHQLKTSLNEVYQDFENDIYDALKSGLNRISNYSKLILIYPKTSFYPYPKRIQKGFMKFCGHHQFEFEIYNDFSVDMELEKNGLYICIEEDDLVILYNEIKKSGFKLEHDIGVISYNDTPLNELLEISVLSVDFDEMGTQTAQIILNVKKARVKIPLHFIDRASA